MKQRIFSTLALLIILTSALFFGGPIAGIWIISLCGVLTQYELYLILEKAGYHPMKRLGLILGMVIILGTFYLPQFSNDFLDNPSAELFTASALICSVAIFGKKEITYKSSSFISTLFGIIYIPYMLMHLVLLMMNTSDLQQGFFLSLWVVVTAKLSDTGGFLVGRFYGKKKLASEISPQKTWEGVIGAVFLSALGAYLFALIGHNNLPESFIPWKAAVIAIPIAFIAIFSDLVESLFKRHAGLKDSGKIVPGIGGAFDLLDSVILSAPTGYLILKYVL